VRAFADAFDQELYGLAMASLNATEAALLALDLTYVGIWQSKMPSPERVRAEVQRLRKDPKVISAQEALKEARDTGATDWGIQQIQNSLRRTVSESSALKFLPTWDIEDFLFGSDDKLYGQLVVFLTSGREHVRKARASIDDLAFLWSADNIIGMEKALLGIERGSILNLIVDQVAHQRRTDTSLWHMLWTVMEFAFMFVPGPIGFALRTAAAIASANSATTSYGKSVSGFETGLMSDKPSSKALTFQLLFTAGGVVLDAALTRPFATAERAPLTIGKAGGEAHPGSMPGLEPPATKPPVATGEAGKAGETVAHEAGALGAPPRTELFRGITDDTVKLLNKHPDIRRVLEAHPNAADLFKKCNSPCFPDFLNARQFEERMTRLELLQEEMDLAGYALNRQAVKDLMHAQTNVRDIDKALKYLEDKFHYQVPSFNAKAAGVAPRPLTGDPRLSPGPGAAPVASGVKGTMGAATHAGELFTELPRRLESRARRAVAAVDREGRALAGGGASRAAGAGRRGADVPDGIRAPVHRPRIHGGRHTAGGIPREQERFAVPSHRRIYSATGKRHFISSGPTLQRFGDRMAHQREHRAGCAESVAVAAARVERPVPLPTRRTARRLRQPGLPPRAAQPAGDRAPVGPAFAARPLENVGMSGAAISRRSEQWLHLFGQHFFVQAIMPVCRP
jgi:hypothetical protein